MVIDVDDILIELDDEIEDYTELRFRCPFCGKEASSLRGCQHFVFSFEMVNFEYLKIKKAFATRVVKYLCNKGYKVEEPPCPLAPWAEDSEGNEIPSLHKIMPGVKLTGYSYSVPHGHGSWGIVVGFEQ